MFTALIGPLIGRASDAFGKFRVFFFGCTVTIVMVLIYTHLGLTPLWLLIGVLSVLQVGIFSRMISASALISALPEPTDRGAYMSISSSLQQVAGGVAAVFSGMIVVQRADGGLLHFERVGYVLVCTTLVTLVMMYWINRTIARLQANRAASLKAGDRVAARPPRNCRRLAFEHAIRTRQIFAAAAHRHGSADARARATAPDRHRSGHLRTGRVEHHVDPGAAAIAAG